MAQRYKNKIDLLKQVYGKSVIDTLNKVIRIHRIKKERENSRSFLYSVLFDFCDIRLQCFLIIYSAFFLLVNLFNTFDPSVQTIRANENSDKHR